MISNKPTLTRHSMQMVRYSQIHDEWLAGPEASFIGGEDSALQGSR